MIRGAKNYPSSDKFALTANYPQEKKDKMALFLSATKQLKV